MDFTDLKKEAAAAADNIFKPHPDEQHHYHNLSGGSAGVASDNAHTEDYFANEQKEADFEHVDAQTFVQRMSAGAKEAQEQLDAKFTQQGQNYDDFLTEATRDLNNFGQQFKQDLKQNMGAATHDFMNMERKYLGDFGGNGDGGKTSIPEVKHETQPAVPVQNLLGDSFIIGNVSAAAPLEPFKETDDLMGTFSKDSDTDTPSVSYNPSPAKKPNRVADALKEQDNEQFISSEDLLCDFKDDFKKVATDVNNTVSSAASLLEAAAAHIPTTDLDVDDENEFKFASEAKAAAAVPATPPATPVLAPTAAAPPVVAPIFTEPVLPAVAPQTIPPLPPKEIKQVPFVAKESQQVKDTDKQANLLFVEEIFYKYGLDAWFKPERLHPVVESLIYWRDVKKSGIVFGVGLITLLAISCFSVISVFAYLSLFTLVGTIAYRSYKSILQAVQKTSDGHPFKDYLEVDLALSQEKVQNIAGVVVAHVNGFVAELRRLFLVEDLVDSIKFGLLLWVLTYIGALFNGMTLVILAFVSLFTLPKVYENNKQSIDTYLELVRSKLAEITEKIKAAIPIGKKPIAAESDKDK